MSIKFSKPNIFDADLSLVKKTIKSGWLTHGKNTKMFEEKFQKYTFGWHLKNYFRSSTYTCFDFSLFLCFDSVVQKTNLKHTLCGF